MAQSSEYVTHGGLVWRVGLNGVPLESPDGQDWLVWRRSADVVFEASSVTAHLRREPHHLNEMVRIGNEYPNRRNAHGYQPIGSLGDRWAWYESTVEQSALLDVDFRGDLAGLASQPFRFLFGDHTPLLRHDADFFAVHDDGSQVVYNVKLADKLSDERTVGQFLEVDRICEQIGWQHIVLTEPPWERLANLRILHAARRPHFHPGPRVFNAILRAFTVPTPVRVGTRKVNPRFPALVMPHVRHLLWHRVLGMDLNTLLDFHTPLAKIEDTPCCA
jgi:hypothetical protein